VPALLLLVSERAATLFGGRVVEPGLAADAEVESDGSGGHGRRSAQREQRDGRRGRAQICPLSCIHVPTSRRMWWLAVQAESRAIRRCRRFYRSRRPLATFERR